MSEFDNLSIYEVADHAGCAPAIVRDLFNRGEIRGHRQVGTGNIMIPRMELERAKRTIRRRTCHECRGTGYVPCGSSHMATCLSCN